MIKHFFQDMSKFEDPWFTYSHLYKQFADILQDGMVMCELGSWKGQSASLIATELKKRK